MATLNYEEMLLAQAQQFESEQDKEEREIINLTLNKLESYESDLLVISNQKEVFIAKGYSAILGHILGILNHVLIYGRTAIASKKLMLQQLNIDPASFILFENSVGELPYRIKDKEGNQTEYITEGRPRDIEKLKKALRRIAICMKILLDNNTLESEITQEDWDRRFNNRRKSLENSKIFNPQKIEYDE